ncbi:MGMT family protein [Oceanobacter antarcticus]|jgi:methylated-DNA-protein-cysteine methyltransferase-like protein|uniref:MGMT family protein n=1 Tax=Oceanobacter antarcticus TaxID=3133425 RepID=A0ABW8NDN2_9GAMM
MVIAPRSVAPVTPNDIRLFTLLASVPPGRVVTYGQLADFIGAPRRARWVGQLLRQLPKDSSLPWHRVINAQGKISLPILEGGREQAERLRAEGVLVSADGRVSLRLYRWMP